MEAERQRLGQEKMPEELAGCLLSVSLPIGLLASSASTQSAALQRVVIFRRRHYNRAGKPMATLTFTIDEALSILRANHLMPESIRDVKADRAGLLVTVPGGIVISVHRELFSGGVLELSFASSSWAFKLADSLGKVDTVIDDAIRDFPYIRRQGRSLFIDLNWALQSRVKGMQVRDFDLSDGAVRIEVS